MVRKAMKREWHLPDRLLPVYADFSKEDAHGNIPLICRGTRTDLRRHHIQLSEGMALYLYDLDENEDGEADDLFVEGIAHWDEELHHWAAIIDAARIRHVSRSEFRGE